MGWELTQVLLISIRKREGFKICVTLWIKTRVKVGGGTLSRVGHDMDFLILSP
jgi:hypothetical protein